MFKHAYSFLKQYPRLSLMTGATTSRIYGRAKTSTTARLHKKTGKYYDVFNSAVWLQGQKTAEFYHKSKLVPGVETIPYSTIFSGLGNWLIDFGGTSGSYGTQKERPMFLVKNGTKIAPLICFESIHGDFTRRYITKGANIFAVITNDGWWGNTDGHRRHFAYTSLRAIETRRDIAFCANTGTSGFINQLGQIKSKTEYAKKAVVRQTLQANNQITTYAQHGDYIGRLSGFVAVGLLLTLIVKTVTKGKTGSLG